MGDPLRHSPLDAEHRALGARMVEFGGWDMPIQYSGVLEEHRACRSDGVVFDVSHLGSVAVRGPGAVAALQWAFTNDLGRIEPGKAQYTHLLDPVDAHVVDDIIVWWLDADELLVMPNASNTDRILGALHEAATDHARRRLRGRGRHRDASGARGTGATRPRAPARRARGGRFGRAVRGPAGPRRPVHRMVGGHRLHRRGRPGAARPRGIRGRDAGAPRSPPA